MGKKTDSLTRQTFSGSNGQLLLQKSNPISQNLPHNALLSTLINRAVSIVNPIISCGYVRKNGQTMPNLYHSAFGGDKDI